MRFFGTFLSRKVPNLQRTCNEVVMATDIKIMLSYCRDRILLCVFSSEFFVWLRLRSLFSERKRNKPRLKQNPSVKITEGFFMLLDIQMSARGD